MPPLQTLNVDAVILGGGAAGLWSLDRLSRAGLRVILLESDALGAGQTIAAQGIIHGGLKYTLDGLLGDSAKAIAGMPLRWRASLAEMRPPNLGSTVLRADWCALWRTTNLRSQFGMAGARVALQVRPVQLERGERPVPLLACPGDVYRLDEPVIDPPSFLADLAERHRSRIVKYELDGGIRFNAAGGQVASIVIANQRGGADLEIKPRLVVLTAGEGNGPLRLLAGLASPAMQLRPLHMVIVRGNLRRLNGHCTDGSRTRVTVTTTVDRAGRNAWQVGGQIAEDGVAMDRSELITHARSELRAVIPSFESSGLEWLTDRVNRAEAVAGGGKRPSDVFCEREGNVITGWPTKLALVPRLADKVAELVGPAATPAEWRAEELWDWPRPEVALPAWERDVEWTRDH